MNYFQLITLYPASIILWYPLSVSVTTVYVSIFLVSHSSHILRYNAAFLSFCLTYLPARAYWIASAHIYMPMSVYNLMNHDWSDPTKEGQACWE